MFLLPKNDKMVTRFGNKTFRLLLFVKFNTKINLKPTSYF